MFLQNLTQLISESDYSGDEEKYILSSLTALQKNIHRIPEDVKQQIERVLEIAQEWNLPARIYKIFLASYLKEYNIESRFDAETVASADHFQKLNQSVVLPRIPEQLLRIQCYDRLRSLFYASFTDLELVLLVLASHRARMESLQAGLLPRRLMIEFCNENEIIYLPLVEMLGIWELHRFLGDMSLRMNNPQNLWVKIDEQIHHHQMRYDRHYENILAILRNNFNEESINGTIDRHSHTVSSIYRRVMRGESLSGLLRKLKVDVLVDKEVDCYRALHLIHKQWPPVGGRTIQGGNFRDLIADPKYNGYRSLITTVGFPDPDGQQNKITAEFRIRTQKMDIINLMGIIANKYQWKEAEIIRNVWWQDEKLLEFVRQRPPSSESKVIYVFSPVGKVYANLPGESTPIDYAYRIHTDVGNHCKRIWINGQNSSFDQKLKNGDLVEIEVDPDIQGPYSRWLSTVATDTAKYQIKRRLQQQRPHKGRQILNGILERELSYYGLEDQIDADYIEKGLEISASHYGYFDLTALYIDIADSSNSRASKKVSPNKIVADIIARKLSKHIILADGKPLDIPPAQIYFAQCIHNKNPCRVSPKAEIIGRLRVSKNGKYQRLTVYRRDCPNAPKEPEGVPLMWQGDRRSDEPVRIRIHAVDSPRLLERILQAFYQLYPQGIYILEASAKVDKEQIASINLTLKAPSHPAVELLVDQLNGLKASGEIHQFNIEALTPLEKLLLVEPDQLPNPYTTGPVSNPRIFKGREFEISQLINFLKGEHGIAVLYGISRVGKTSLLRYLNDYIATEYNLVPVLIDLQKLPFQDEAHFWQEVANCTSESIARLFNVHKLGIKIRPDGMEFERFTDWLGETSTKIRGRRLLLMFDEWNIVDELWKDGNDALKLVYHLKSFGETNRNVSILICVQETLYRTAIQHQGKVMSWQLLRAGAPVHLDYLDPTSAERLIREPMGQLIRYQPGVVEKIIHLTACHPYYIHLIQSILIDRIRQDHRNLVELDDLNTATDNLMDSGQHLFHGFLQDLYGLNEIVVKAIAQLAKEGNETITLDDLLNFLHKRDFQIKKSKLIEVLELLGDVGILTHPVSTRIPTHKVRVPLFTRWLQKNRPFH